MFRLYYRNDAYTIALCFFLLYICCQISKTEKRLFMDAKDNVMRQRLKVFRIYELYSEIDMVNCGYEKCIPNFITSSNPFMTYPLTNPSITPFMKCLCSNGINVLLFGCLYCFSCCLVKKYCVNPKGYERKAFINSLFYRIVRRDYNVNTC
jgi:hypothetical protein